MESKYFWISNGRMMLTDQGRTLSYRQFREECVRVGISPCHRSTFNRAKTGKEITVEYQKRGEGVKRVFARGIVRITAEEANMGTTELARRFTINPQTARVAKKRAAKSGIGWFEVSSQSETNGHVCQRRESVGEPLPSDLF